MNGLPVRPLSLLLCLCLVPAAGCFSLGKTSPQARLYLLPGLSPSEDAGYDQRNDRGTLVSIGGVQIPAYLDRPQIVVRTEEGTIEVSELDRWAAPLDAAVHRVLVNNLSLLMPEAGITSTAWKVGVSTDFSLWVEICRFDGTRGGDCVLEARWVILGKDGRELLRTAQRRYRRPTGGKDYEDMVNTLGRLLEDCSRDIARDLTELAATTSAETRTEKSPSEAR